MSKIVKSKALRLCASAIAMATVSSAASAHMVQFGWQETAAGTVLWAEHWHGALGAPYSDNGGLTITDTVTLASITVQWASVLNGAPVGTLGLTGSQCDPVNSGCNAHDNWLVTSAIPLGNGIYSFFTGTNCCVDTMGAPVIVTITGITTQPPGIGTGVPEPGTWGMMLMGFGAIGYAMRRRKRYIQNKAIPQLA